ncbi:helix-turn-helix transcriptional regulator [Shouchella clausii]|uniref:helix-turn-helix transcriptional regulator n=1 Tax=Shouchella clausii TaxID=79880 RepID=UPI00289965D2|nr:helix-turn-helix transcriptional regulator [Shouchella clausii]
MYNKGVKKQVANPRLKLINARKEKNLSPRQIAEMLNISMSYYYKIERGTRNPGLYLAKDISSILGQSVDDLFIEDQLPALSNY